MMLLAVIICLIFAPVPAALAATAPPPANPMGKGKQVPGPTNASDPDILKAWHSDMLRWRDEYRKSTHYNGAIYDDPQLKWTQTSYMQPQMHPCESWISLAAAAVFAAPAACSLIAHCPPLHVHAAPRPGAVRVVQTTGTFTTRWRISTRCRSGSTMSTSATAG
jgi:hypothetical protein